MQSTTTHCVSDTAQLHAQNIYITYPSMLFVAFLHSHRVSNLDTQFLTFRILSVHIWHARV